MAQQIDGQPSLLMATRLLIDQLDVASPPDLVVAATILQSLSTDFSLSASRRRLCVELAKLLRREAQR